MRLVLDSPPPTPEAVTLTTVRAPASQETAMRLIEGNNLDVLDLVREEVRAHLVYLDPPFFTQRAHHRVRRKRSAKGAIKRTEHAAFDDRWASLDAYLATLRARLEALWSILAPEGSLVVHVDPTTSHYVKVMCDDLFGVRCFASEIVWRYRRWPAKTPNFQRVHDVLLRYVRDPEATPRFHQLFEPLAPSTLATWGKKKQRARFEGKRRVRSESTEEASPGAPLGDVWEIGIIAPVARERTGYPTQKPIALLRRVVEALTEPGDLVVDPYVGSGTTLAAAAELGRRGLGIDDSAEAVAVTTKRLADARIDLWHQRAERLEGAPEPPSR